MAKHKQRTYHILAALYIAAFFGFCFFFVAYAMYRHPWFNLLAIVILGGLRFVIWLIHDPPRERSGGLPGFWK